MTIYRSYDHAKEELRDAWDELQCALDLEEQSGVLGTLNTAEAVRRFDDAWSGFKAIQTRPEENQRCWDYADEIASGRY